MLFPSLDLVMIDKFLASEFSAILLHDYLASNNNVAPLLASLFNPSMAVQWINLTVSPVVSAVVAFFGALAK
jgi:hypothetical protein